MTIASDDRSCERSGDARGEGGDGVEEKDEATPRLGHTTGWSVDEDPEGGFRWSADGPTGTLRGRAPTRDEAEAAAHAAEQRLLEEYEQRRRPGPEVELRGDDAEATRDGS
jgi:hypothetical protein